MEPAVDFYVVLTTLKLVTTTLNLTIVSSNDQNILIILKFILLHLGFNFINILQEYNCFLFKNEN